MPNPDLDPDEVKEVQTRAHKLYKEYGADAKMIWFLSILLHRTAEEVADIWKNSRQQFNDALNSDGVFRG